jgi:hypothetical protein
LEIGGFNSPIRLDRDVNATGKSIGGGICIYSNERWCKDYTIRAQVCTKDIELLAVSFRPFYLPREFGQLFVTVVYIPPDANTQAASNTILDITQTLEGLSATAPKFILGDFNACTLNEVLPQYYQYVDCPTRALRTIDLCYGNIKGAYKSIAKPPLGGSDHNCIHLLPTYRQKLKTVKPVTKTIKVWTPDTLDQLKGCFEWTNWEVFQQACHSLEELVVTITDYITFCVDTIIPTKTVKIYANNKPWIDKELKSLLNEKKRAFCAGNKVQVKVVQKKINAQIKTCKKQYVDKIEKQFSENDLRYAWAGVKSIISASKKQHSIETDDNISFAKDLNNFYSRFDCHDFARQRQEVLNSLVNQEPPKITEEQVIKSFLKINPRKASGPDGVLGIVLKECRTQLAGIFRDIFQTSLDSHVIPQLWKTSNIIPVPKKTHPLVQNDYRPVALTSIAMKCLERIIKCFLLHDTEHLLDSMQFAYRHRRGVEDATMTLLNSIYKHLDKPSSYVRLTFVDFSSAFNTLQPYLLLNKLNDMKVNTSIIRWIDDFMFQRPQYVTVNGVTSSILHISTGAPQGCVISPILFILYTNDCLCCEQDCFMVKFADDTVLAGLLTDTEVSYHNAVQHLVDWCNLNFLHLNSKKTKELIIDFRKKAPIQLQPVTVNSDEIEQVEVYKYLGTEIDCKLSWKSNSDMIYKKSQQRLHFLRCLRQLNVDKQIMILFYKTFIVPVLCFNFLSWFSCLTLQSKNKLCKITNVASKIIGQKMDSLDSLYERHLMKKVNKILKDSSHNLWPEYSFLPSGRRLRSMSCKTKRTQQSFVATSIRLYNKLCKL